MEVYITKQRNNLYSVSKFKPVIDRVYGTSDMDCYFVPGEPIGVRNLCDILLKLARIDPKSLQPLQSIKIILTAQQIPNENYGS